MHSNNPNSKTSPIIVNLTKNITQLFIKRELRVGWILGASTHLKRTTRPRSNFPWSIDNEATLSKGLSTRIPILIKRSFRLEYHFHKKLGTVAKSEAWRGLKSTDKSNSIQILPSSNKSPRDGRPNANRGHISMTEFTRRRRILVRKRKGHLRRKKKLKYILVGTACWNFPLKWFGRPFEWWIDWN